MSGHTNSPMGRGWKFAHLTINYSQAMLHWLFEDAFEELLVCWREHERRRSHQLVGVRAIAESRYALDRARQRVNSFRRVIHPTQDERQLVVQSVFCSELNAMAQLSWQDRDPNDDRVYWCLCGQPVEVSPLDDYVRERNIRTRHAEVAKP